MYSNFVLRKLKDGIINGYLWDVIEPDKVICIVHGIGEYGGRFDRVAEALREKNMAAAAMDLRGHGNSAGKKGHCAPRKDVLDDVTELIRFARTEYPGKKVVLYGHSMGGNIVLDYRSRGELNGDIAGYIISAPWIRLVRPVPAVLYRIVKLMSKAAPSFTISSEVDEEVLGHPDSVRPYKDNPMVHNRISALCAVDGFETGLKLEEGTLEDNHAAADIPTLIMHGGSDMICDVKGSRKIAERLEKQGEKIEYIEWDGLYHEIHNGNSQSRGDEVVNKIAEWAKAL
ncbi:MAG: lysophospholipase [Firmicutes bacterium]|nr:lysophospholipase [Bacillota bacterium]